MNLEPVLDVFGGADGGIAFIRLRAFIDSIEKVEDKTPLQEEFLKSVSRFIELCNVMMD